MSLTICPDCGHEVSIAATACPNCGHPFAKPVIERKVVVADTPREKGIPTWVFAVLGILGVLVLFILFAATRNNDDETANRSLNVNVASARDSSSNTRDTARSTTDSQTVTSIPPSTDSQTVTVPSTSAPSSVSVPQSSSSTTTVTTVPADKGTVVIDAKIATKTGTPQAVRNEKFYLLDKDLESILSDADVEPINGQSLTNSLGLAIMYPSRYGDFQKEALNAINKHIKYRTETDSSGKGQMKNIEPDSYYLFGITKSGNGFAVWSSPVTIQNGENVLNLSPQRLTEIREESQYEE